MGVNLDEYIDKVTSTQPASFDNLSGQDKKGVVDGKAYQGMTREGVLVALGYFAVHRTSTLDATT